MRLAQHTCHQIWPNSRSRKEVKISPQKTCSELKVGSSLATKIKMSKSAKLLNNKQICSTFSDNINLQKGISILKRYYKCVRTSRNQQNIKIPHRKDTDRAIGISRKQIMAQPDYRHNFVKCWVPSQQEWYYLDLQGPFLEKSGRHYPLKMEFQGSALC